MSNLQNKTCCIIGGRSLPDGQAGRMRMALQEEILHAYLHGCTRFISGLDAGAGRCFAELVLEMRGQGAPVQLDAALPWRGHYRRLLASRDTRQLLAECTQVRVLYEEYSANSWMLHGRQLAVEADILVAVLGIGAHVQTELAVQAARSRGCEVRLLPLLG